MIVGAGFVALLVDLQTVRADRYRSLGEDQRIRTRQIAGYRGSVVDRNGFVLAASTPSHQIVADPILIESPRTTASLLAPILDVDVETLVELLTPGSEDDRFSLLAREVGDEAITQIQHLEGPEGTDPLLGIFILPEEDRVYPAGESGRAVVGRVDPDEQGIFGVELLYDTLMTGIPGTERYEEGKFGSISVGDWRVDPATAGYDVVLTLDARVQHVTEEALLGSCERTGAASATAVVSDPRTGELLAVASVVADEGECVIASYNTALVNTYELGSVMKPLVVAAAIEENGFTADSLVEVPSRLTIGGKVFEDHPGHPAAPFPISQVIADSMNVGTIVLSQQIPAETLHAYLRAFGLGRPTGLAFEGEGAGLLRHPDDWWGSDYGSIPIGQGVTMNAVQLLTAYNALANGGHLVPPVLVQELRSPDGRIEHPPVGTPEPIVSPATAAEITSALEAVVAEGTGRMAAVPGFSVAGKTGTAWKVFDDGSGSLGYGAPGNRRYVLTFVGYLPADQPELSVVVILDEPDGGEVAAGDLAAPVFSEIATYAARILGLVPDVSDPADVGGRVRGTPAGVVVDDPIEPPEPPEEAGSPTDGDVDEPALPLADGDPATDLDESAPDPDAGEPAPDGGPTPDGVDQPATDGGEPRPDGDEALDDAEQPPLDEDVPPVAGDVDEAFGADGIVEGGR